MTAISANCPTCGDITLTPEDVRLVVYRNMQSWSHYDFRCSSCGSRIRKPADEAVRRLLRAAGVQPQITDVPAEALETRIGPPLTTNDLLDFMLQLDKASAPALLCARTDEVGERSGGPPITYDDLLDFGAALARIEGVPAEIADQRPTWRHPRRPGGPRGGHRPARRPPDNDP